jgi:hypothetical protein
LYQVICSDGWECGSRRGWAGLDGRGSAPRSTVSALSIVPELLSTVPELLSTVPELLSTVPELLSTVPELLSIVPELLSIVPARSTVPARWTVPKLSIVPNATRSPFGSCYLRRWKIWAGSLVGSSST